MKVGRQIIVVAINVPVDSLRGFSRVSNEFFWFEQERERSLRAIIVRSLNGVLIFAGDARYWENISVSERQVYLQPKIFYDSCHFIQLIILIFLLLHHRISRIIFSLLISFVFIDTISLPINILEFSWHAQGEWGNEKKREREEADSSANYSPARRIIFET